jgi:transposase
MTQPTTGIASHMCSELGPFSATKVSQVIRTFTAKGTKGGRPPGFDQQTYAKRNTVERGYLRLKQWRG